MCAKQRTNAHVMRLEIKVVCIAVLAIHTPVFAESCFLYFLELQKNVEKSPDLQIGQTKYPPGRGNM